MQTLTVQSRSKDELIDITSRVQDAVREEGIDTGICLVYTPHTTAGITVNENADPDVKDDIILGLSHLDLEKVPFRHAEGNSPAHCKSSLVGCSETFIVEGGSLMLGTWQGIYFCEFDGPRRRKVHVRTLQA